MFEQCPLRPTIMLALLGHILSQEVTVHPFKYTYVRCDFLTEQLLP